MDIYAQARRNRWATKRWRLRRSANYTGTHKAHYNLLAGLCHEVLSVSLLSLFPSLSLRLLDWPAFLRIFKTPSTRCESLEPRVKLQSAGFFRSFQSINWLKQAEMDNLASQRSSEGERERAHVASLYCELAIPLNIRHNRAPAITIQLTNLSCRRLTTYRSLTLTHSLLYQLIL